MACALRETARRAAPCPRACRWRRNRRQWPCEKISAVGRQVPMARSLLGDPLGDAVGELLPVRLEDDHVTVLAAACGRVRAYRRAMRSTMRAGMKRSSSAAITSIGQRTRVRSIGTPVIGHLAAGAAAIGNHQVEERILPVGGHAIHHDVAARSSRPGVTTRDRRSDGKYLSCLIATRGDRTLMPRGGAGVMSTAARTAPRSASLCATRPPIEWPTTAGVRRAGRRRMRRR